MEKATYHQLDVVLRAYGFAVREPEPGLRVYRHPGGALLLIPLLPDTDAVPGHHVVATRLTLDAFGIADPPEFVARLGQAG